VVFGEGRTAVDLYFIEQGQIKTSKVNADGKELITGVYRQGSFLGYVELLQGTPYNETAMALEDSQLTVIPKADFLTLIYTSRDVARKFINMLSNNINQMENRLLDIAYQSVRQRVAGILLELLDGQSLNSLISFTRRDMSSMVGTAPESFNRTLADLKEEGLIEIFHEGIRIIDKSKLEKLLR
jgi:CRP-like cAMP-binding protein